MRTLKRSPVHATHRGTRYVSTHRPRGRKGGPVWTWSLAVRVFLLCAMVLGVTVPALALDDGITTLRTFPAGSYIIDMGQPVQTIANGLKPYGLVYALIRNQRVPVDWVINPNKAKDGIDFSTASKAYRGGPFLIDATYITPAVITVINAWRAQGVVVDGPTTSSLANLPVYERLTSFPNTILDAANGSIAASFATAAGIPNTSYTFKAPSLLNSCDDFYAMPHADPTWTTHRNLLPWVRQGGSLWAGCHAVSVLENLDDPTTLTRPDMNFLSQTGLVPFGRHSDGSPPYVVNGVGGEPILQFLGNTDSAQQNGSEQIYLPALAGGWRASTRVLVSDPTQVNVPTLSPGPAVAMAYGHAFGSPTAGYVMYEGSHNVGGSAPANVAAQRAYLNELLLAGILSRIEVTANVPSTVNSGQSINLSGSTTGGSGTPSYQWSSSGGGSFSPSATVASPTFTAPIVTTTTQIILRLAVTDLCGRTNFTAVVVVVEPLQQADLSLSKTGTASVQLNGTVSYNLTVINQGPSLVSGAVVTDLVPANLTGVTWSCSASGSSSCGSVSSGSGNSIVLTSGSLGIGAAHQLTLTVTGTASTAGTITNTGSVAPPAGIVDPVSNNNSASQPTVILPPVDLRLTKTAPAEIFSGSSYSYTLDVSNLSAIPATSLVLSDVLDPALTYVQATGSGWSCGYAAALRRLSCNLAALAAGATSTLTLTVTPSGTPGELLSNTATVTNLDAPDSDGTNNSATATSTFAAPADLRLSKTGTASGGGGSQTNTFTITLTNNGPGTAHSIVVTDTLSGPDLSRLSALSSAVASVGTFTPVALTGGTWNIATLAPGASATLTLVYLGDNNDGVTNTVVATASTYDPNLSNNRAEVTILDGTPVLIDLSLSKVAAPTTVAYGGTITYALVVQNTSTSTDWSGGGRVISVTDALPPGVTFVSALGTNWTSCAQVSGVVTCTYDRDINRGTSSTTLNITVTAPSAVTTLVNTATLRAERNRTVDPTTGNNSATATVTVVAPNADIALTKTVSSSTPNLGTPVTFTVTATNLGPSNATGVQVSDLLPAGFSATASIPSQGVYDSGSGAWFVGALANGAAATLRLTATVNQTGSLTNTASLVSLDQNDPNAGNNSASAAVSAVAADLALAIAVDNATPHVGSPVVLTLTLRNNGPSATGSASVEDVLPAGLEYVSSTASQGIYTPASGGWSGLSLANGATATLSITAIMTQPDSVTDSASITASAVPDPQLANNSTSLTVTGQQVDLEVSKAVNNTRPLTLEAV